MSDLLFHLRCYLKKGLELEVYEVLGLFVTKLSQRKSPISSEKKQILWLTMLCLEKSKSNSVMLDQGTRGNKAINQTAESKREEERISEY